MEGVYHWHTTRPLAVILDEVRARQQCWVEAFAARQMEHWDEDHGGVRTPIPGCQTCDSNEILLLFHQEKLAEVEQEIQLQPRTASLVRDNYRCSENELEI
jgi:hypothetical protein